MQLKYIKISNLISFPWVEDLGKEKWVSFSHGKNSWVNILIGPNGSGKSSFLEIINQVFKVWLLKDFIYHKSLLVDWVENQNWIITENIMYSHNLVANFDTPDKPSQVRLKLSLQENDFDNLSFICKFSEELNNIISKYSSLNVVFTPMQIESLLNIKELDLVFDIDIKNRKISLSNEFISPEEAYIFYYIQNHELVQICMNIYNDFEKSLESRKWYPLKNTFAILNSERHFWDIIWDSDKMLHISPDNWDIYLSGQNTKSYYSVSIGYYLCLVKLSKIEDMKKSIFYRKLNKQIYMYLWMTLELQNNEWIAVLVLKDNWWHIYSLDELSSWDQSLLMVIFSVFWYDLDSWLIIIDEPELHLHPQWQKKIIRMIEKMSQDLHLQVILATHSPLMIDEKNISCVYRFLKKDKWTQILNPNFHIWADEAELIHMLKLGNIAKIFFVDKIIMVEWETDEYFFDFYLNYLKESDSIRKDNIKDFEILNIQWKGWVHRWKRFLSRFGINSYYIGDWDNTIDEWIVDKFEMKRYRREAHKHTQDYIHRNNFISKHRYWLLVDTIQRYYPEKYKIIVDKIVNLYKHNVFILKKWDLETYLGMHTKWLDDTIRFCHEYFSLWIKNPLFDVKRSELNEVFWIIFDCWEKI